MASLGHPCKFQRVSLRGSVTASKLLNGGQQNFAVCLAVSWAGTLYMHFGGCCPLTEFCVQVLRSLILAALLHGTPAASAIQTLCRGTRNGITELSQRALPIFGWATITLGIGLHSSLLSIFFCPVVSFYLLSSSSFIFPRLISAAGGGMSTIL